MATLYLHLYIVSLLSSRKSRFILSSFSGTMDCREQELEKFNHELFVARSYRKFLTGTGSFKTDFSHAYANESHACANGSHALQRLCHGKFRSKLP